MQTTWEGLKEKKPTLAEMSAMMRELAGRFGSGADHLEEIRKESEKFGFRPIRFEADGRLAVEIFDQELFDATVGKFKVQQ